MERLDGQDARLQFGAAVLGFSTVEVIRKTEDGYVAIPLTAPPVVGQAKDSACLRTPVALAVSDCDGDGNSDLLVEDPCGNYVALAAGAASPRVEPWSNVLPPSWAYPYVEAALGSGVFLVYGTNSEMTVTGRQNGSSDWSPPRTLQIEPPWLETLVAHPYVPIRGLPGGGEIDWLVQQTQQLSVVGTEGDGEPAPRARMGLTQLQTEPPNLQPFAGYDHLTPIQIPGCAPQAIGIGLFPKESGIAPRRLQLLSFDSESVLGGHYGVHEISLSMEVTSVGIIERQNEGDIVVGALGTRNGSWIFALLRMSACGQIQNLAEAPIEFERRMAPTPGFYDAKEVPRTDGVLFVSHRTKEPEVLSYVHYDGYTVRAIIGRPTATGWILSQENVLLHEERSDLAVPGR